MVDNPDVLLVLLGLNLETLILEGNILEVRFVDLNNDIVALFILFELNWHLGDLNAHNRCDRVNRVLGIQVDVKFLLFVFIFILVTAFHSRCLIFLLGFGGRW